MKKIIFALAIIASIGFTGCSGDDDGDGNTRNCSILGLVPATFVDNGDGTATITVEGESDVVDLDGVPFETFTDQICSGDLELDFGL
ncbi:hypothetical protein ACOKFD_12135 [Flagellimonas sp. S174]|uniref:hypothetical protein n=1 Tax=Flagellimonas sp. S174 TaxID=3410790 RepID=UPI002630604B|nr:hypothetical protein [uncultured Allomuricauda sp.]